ncbi:MAG TPA: DEAD/DEAH box helicase [bacterium]|nr:DEAD/DEAH box helicase [bacterium]
MTLNTFDRMNIIPPILLALKEEGYSTPTPIQTRAIPVIFEGKDIFGIAQTGTGKTAAFAIPIIQKIHTNHTSVKGRRNIKTLICTPTRELAIQIGESFTTYGRHTHVRNTVIFGGVNQFSQVSSLKQGVDVLIATPGRFLDLHNQGYISLDHLDTFVLDEADRMLDMGFIHDIKRIIKILPSKRQTLLFSATMPSDILTLASKILIAPVKVEVTPVTSTAEAISQVCYFVDKGNKKNLLAHLLKDPVIVSALIFTRTKHGADKVVKDLRHDGVTASAIHGNKSQSARQRALSDFKEGKCRVLVATDIAARGIDIDELSHVINFDLPNIPETYIHRIGRTGRAGLTGCAISFCDSEEREYLKDIQKLTGRVIPKMEKHLFMPENSQSEKTMQVTKKAMSERGNPRVSRKRH